MEKDHIHTIELFDSHCHIDEEKFDEDRDVVLQRMSEYGITRYAVIGTDIPTSQRAVEFAKTHPGAYAAVGFHPHEASKLQLGDLDLIANMLKEQKVQAIGEIGLDYYYDLSPRDVQQRVCEEQIELAYALNVPVAYHIRDAHQDMLQIMKDHKSHLTGGIIHCFSGSWEIAKQYLKLGYYISFAGPVTFKKAPKLQEAAIHIPSNRLLIETDSPYLAPQPVRGRRNDPSNVRYVCEKLAQLRGETLEEVAAYTTRNALDAYRINEQCNTKPSRS